MKNVNLLPPQYYALATAWLEISQGVYGIGVYSESSVKTILGIYDTDDHPYWDDESVLAVRRCIREILTAEVNHA